MIYHGVFGIRISWGLLAEQIVTNDFVTVTFKYATMKWGWFVNVQVKDASNICLKLGLYMGWTSAKGEF